MPHCEIRRGTLQRVDETFPPPRGSDGHAPVVAAGQLDELVTATYPIEGFQSALDELHEGKLARGVLVLD